jgi:transposase
VTEEHDEVDRYAEYVDDEMDVREILDVICELREDSKAPRELVYAVAETAGTDREDAARYLKEFVSTVEIVELDEGYVQTRRHFEEDLE